MEKIIGKVDHHEIWWDRKANYDNPPKMYIQEIEIKPDSVGYYYLSPTHQHVKTGDYIQSARYSWSELQVVEYKNYIGKEVWKHEFQLSFYSVSSNHVRSATPFLVLNMDKAMFDKWKEQDYWLRNESWYIIRENGKKFYGGHGVSGEGKRCMVCRTLQKRDATVCELGC